MERLNDKRLQPWGESEVVVSEPFLIVEQFGADVRLADNTAALQNAFDMAAQEGKELHLSSGTYTCLSSLYAPPGLKLRGVDGHGSRLEKAFETRGDNALLMGSAPGVDLRAIEFGAFAHTIGGLKTNKLVLLTGDNVSVVGCRFNKWSGWALTTFGSNVLIQGNEFADPLLVGEIEGNGTDGIHVGGGSGIVICDNSGVSSDDSIALLTPLTGPYTNRDIRDVEVYGNSMRSYRARAFAAGIWDASLTSTVENIDAHHNAFTSDFCVTGAVYISSLAASGITRNIRVRDCRVEGPTSEGSVAAISIRAQNGGVMKDIAFQRITGTGGAVNAIQTLGHFDGLAFDDVTLDASMCSGPAFVVTSPAGAKGLSIDRMKLAAGAGNGFSLALGSAPLIAPRIEATVTGVKDEQFALQGNAVTDGIFDITAIRDPIARAAGGIKEGHLCANNRFENADLSRVDIPTTAPLSAMSERRSQPKIW